MKNKTVIILGSFNTNNGITTFIKRNYSQLIKMGWNFRFINIANAKPARELREIGHYTEVLQLKLGPVQHFKDLCRVLRKERKYSSVIHFHIDSLHNFLPLLIAKAVGYKRIIVHSHSDQRGQYSVVKQWAQLIGMKICALVANDFIACSQNAADFFYSKKVQQKPGFQIILNTVDLQKFKYNSELDHKVRNEMKIEPKTFIVGHCGRFNHQKNHEFILKAFAHFHDVYSDSKLVLIGNGTNLEKSKQQAKKLGIFEDTIFTGYINNVAEVQNVFDVFVLPSFYEGLSLSLLENAANGSQCVVSDTQSPESYWLDSTRKINIKTGSEKLWAEQILNIAESDRCKAQQSEKNIKELTRLGFSQEASVDKLVKLYD